MLVLKIYKSTLRDAAVWTVVLLPVVVLLASAQPQGLWLPASLLPVFLGMQAFPRLLLRSTALLGESVASPWVSSVGSLSSDHSAVETTDIYVP